MDLRISGFKGVIVIAPLNSTGCPKSMDNSKTVLLEINQNYNRLKYI